MPLEPDQVRRAIEARDRLQRARREELLARGAFQETVAALNQSGASLREIADALDLSHQRVHQIVEGGAPKGWWARATRRGPRPPRFSRCSFCGVGQDQVRKLVAGPGILICDDCIGVGARAVAGQGPLPDDRATFTLVEASARDTRCSFCGKNRSSVEAMAAGTGGTICNHCLELCNEVLAEDPGRP